MGDCLTLGDQSQSLPINFSGPANCPMKRRAETLMSGAARTLQVWGEEGGTHMHDIHDGMLESRLSMESGLRTQDSGLRTLEVVTKTQKSVGAG